MNTHNYYENIFSNIQIQLNKIIYKLATKHKTPTHSYKNDVKKRPNIFKFLNIFQFKEF